MGDGAPWDVWTLNSRRWYETGDRMADCDGANACIGGVKKHDGETQEFYHFIFTQMILELQFGLRIFSTDSAKVT